MIPVVICLTCLFKNKLHFQAPILQTFVLVILPELVTDVSFGKVRAKNDDRWRIHLLETSARSFVLLLGILVQPGAIWVLLKDIACPCKSIFKKDRTV